MTSFTFRCPLPLVILYNPCGLLLAPLYPSQSPCHDAATDTAPVFLWPVLEHFVFFHLVFSGNYQNTQHFRFIFLDFHTKIHANPMKINRYVIRIKQSHCRHGFLYENLENKSKIFQILYGFFYPQKGLRNTTEKQSRFPLHSTPESPDPFSRFF